MERAPSQRRSGDRIDRGGEADRATSGHRGEGGRQFLVEWHAERFGHADPVGGIPAVHVGPHQDEVIAGGGSQPGTPDSRSLHQGTRHQHSVDGTGGDQVGAEFGQHRRKRQLLGGQRVVDHGGFPSCGLETDQHLLDGNKHPIDGARIDQQLLGLLERCTGKLQQQHPVRIEQMTFAVPALAIGQIDPAELGPARTIGGMFRQPPPQQLHRTGAIAASQELLGVGANTRGGGTRLGNRLLGVGRGGTQGGHQSGGRGGAVEEGRCHSGMHPCFLGGFRSRLEASVFRPSINFARVSRGSITSSM